MCKTEDCNCDRVWINVKDPYDIVQPGDIIPGGEGTYPHPSK